MAPSFPNKSVQGIIDIIHAELTCFGTISDKSIKAIITAAAAQGITITDRSVQGIINALAGASCGITFDPSLAFTWTPQAFNVYTSYDGVHFNSYLTSAGAGYIAGTVTSPPSDLTKNCILLISIRVWDSSRSTILKKINLPVLAGPTSRAYSDTWQGSLSTVSMWDSSQSLNVYTAGTGTYYLMPTIYKSASYINAILTITGNINDPIPKIPYEAKLDQWVAGGDLFTWDVACAASVVDSSSQITKAKYVGIDLFDKYAQNPTGITLLSGGQTAAGNSASMNNDPSVVFYSGMTSAWNNITNPL